MVLCAALAVRLSPRGPVLFRQRRVGLDGKEFDLYKFRSICLPLEPAELIDDGSSTLKSLLDGDTVSKGVEKDNRITTIGRFLRHSALDELPQLLNVMRGEMSMIGPRPEHPGFVELFGRDTSHYDDRHRVKPGITGWAQVHGLRGQTSLAERVEWDNYYSAHWSLGLDLKIVALTLMVLFRSE